MGSTSTLIVPDLAFDLRNLKYAIVVAEYGSFRRAAHVLEISQSTVTRRVQLLERRLGVVLFERNRCGAKPTSAGGRFMRDAAVGAEYLRQAIADIVVAQRSVTGELRIGLLASLAAGFLSELLSAFHRSYPDVQVKVEEATSRAIAAGVLNGRLDAAFIPGTPQVPGCETRYLWEEQIFVAVPDEHRLAEQAVILWGDLRDEMFLVSASAAGPEVEGLLMRQLSSLGFHPNISVQHVSRDTLVNMVGKGFGITLVAHSTRETNYPGVIFVPIEDSGAIVSSSVIWSPTNSNPALKRLLDLSVLMSRARATV